MCVYVYRRQIQFKIDSNVFFYDTRLFCFLFSVAKKQVAPILLSSMNIHIYCVFVRVKKKRKIFKSLVTIIVHVSRIYNNNVNKNNFRKKQVNIFSMIFPHFHFHFNRLSKRKIFRYLVIDHQKMIMMMMMMKNEWTSEQTSFFFWQIISGLSSSSDSIWSKKKKKKKSITIDLCIDQ